MEVIPEKFAVVALERIDKGWSSHRIGTDGEVPVGAELRFWRELR